MSERNNADPCAVCGYSYGRHSVDLDKCPGGVGTFSPVIEEAAELQSLRAKVAAQREWGKAAKERIRNLEDHIAEAATRSLTRREQFAGLAMSGVLSNTASLPGAKVAEYAVRCADALIVALDDPAEFPNVERAEHRDTMETMIAEYTTAERMTDAEICAWILKHTAATVGEDEEDKLHRLTPSHLAALVGAIIRSQR